MRVDVSALSIVSHSKSSTSLLVGELLVAFHIIDVLGEEYVAYF